MLLLCSEQAVSKYLKQLLLTSINVRRVGIGLSIPMPAPMGMGLHWAALS